MIKSKTTTTLELDHDRNIRHAYTSLYQGYDREGRLISKIVYNASGEADQKTLYTFSEEGQLIEQTVFARQDRLQERIDYFYEEGQLIRTETTQADGEKSIKEYHYDPVENIEKAVLNSANGEIEGFEILWYGSGNEVIAEVKTDTHNRTAYKRFATYDGAGRLVMEEIFGRDEVFEKRTIYRYTPEGLLTEITAQGPSKKLLNTEAFTYNSEGQMLERTITQHTENKDIRIRYRYNQAGKQIADETYENDRLIFRSLAKHDRQGNLVEEEIISVNHSPLHAIRKHVIEYW